MTLTIDTPPQHPVLAMLEGVSEALQQLDDAQLWRLSDEEVAALVDAAYDLTTRAHALALIAVGRPTGATCPGWPGRRRRRRG